MVVEHQVQDTPSSSMNSILDSSMDSIVEGSGSNKHTSNNSSSISSRWVKDSR
jgi:hypothetical protein